MKKTMTIWICLSQGCEGPFCYSKDEDAMQAYLDHLHTLGRNGYSYADEKKQGFVQAFEVAESRLRQIEDTGICYLWLNQELTGVKPCTVVALSDTMNDVAAQVSVVWGEKVSKNHLLTQYMFTPKHVVIDVDGWDVKLFKVDAA